MADNVTITWQGKELSPHEHRTLPDFLVLPQWEGNGHLVEIVNMHNGKFAALDWTLDGVTGDIEATDVVEGTLTEATMAYHRFVRQYSK